MSAPVREGDVLAGKYRIDKVLGIGGMGVVVAAHHIELDEKVAIKFLLPETLGNTEAVVRFGREARAAVKIKSEHVARVSDVGKLESGAPYMVMEYLEGGDLSTWLGQRGALPVEQAVEFILQACEAIAEAHALGIVHRDLKPANLFVVRRADGVLSVKVLDFGISKTTSLGGSGPSASMTKTSALMGSPLYMSPEQMQSSKDVDARGDIWALGVLLYELVAGDTPFTGETMPELILQIMSAPPRPLRDKRPDAPDGLEAAILKCLEKDRGKRFQTIGEFAMALLPFGPPRAKSSVERISGVMMAAGLSANALALPPASDQPSAPPTTGAGTAASFGRTMGVKSRGPWMVFGSIGVLAVLGVTFLAARKPAPTEAPSTALAATSPVVMATAPSPRPEATAEITTEPPPPAHAEAALHVDSPAPLTAKPADHAPPPPAPLARAHAAPRSVKPPPAARQIVSATTPLPSSNCNPSFYFDSLGNKHFKPECFH